MYCSVVTGAYRGSLPRVHVGRHSMRAPWFGLQKNAIDCRCGVTASVSLIWRAGGATTRCSVERRTSLLQRASRSPALITMVPGCEVV